MTARFIGRRHQAHRHCAEVIAIASSFWGQTGKVHGTPNQCPSNCRTLLIRPNWLAGWLKNSLTNCLSQAASREHDSRQFMWQLPLSGRALSPKTAHSTHSAPPDHDVNELGHQVGGMRVLERERGQPVTEHGTNKCVCALALRLPHFDMLHICLTPHVTKSPRHGEEVAV